MVQQAARDAAKQLLAKPGVVITADDDQACLMLLRFLSQILRHGPFFSNEVMEDRVNAMMPEAPFQISSHGGVLVDRLRVDNNNDANHPRLMEIRQCFCHRPPRLRLSFQPMMLRLIAELGQSSVGTRIK